MLWLDFDGVLADSAYECLYLVESIEGKLSNEQGNVFKNNRYLVNEPYGFFILHDLCRSNVEISSLKFCYNKLYNSFPNSKIVDLHQTFFDKRRFLVKRDIGEWCNINPPTSFFNKLRALDLDRQRIKIVSTKNFHALKTWLDFYEFDVGQIFGNDEYRSFKNKFNIIKYQSISNSIFIDDNYERLYPFH